MIMDLKKCLACGAGLEKEIRKGIRDELIVECKICGKYIMSMEFYEDYIMSDASGSNKEALKHFLEKHRGDTLRPWISEELTDVPEGYKIYSQYASHFLYKGVK